MYLLIVFIPLVGAIFSGFGGKLLGERGSSLFSLFFIIITQIIASIAFYFVALKGNSVYFTLSPWFLIGSTEVNWGFMFDSLTVTILVVVTTVSSLVHLYSTSYISEDPHRPRFISYLSLFTFFILILVTADNFIQMFVGWEGVGLCSYLLINFWFTRIQANKAAIKAILVNRIGDFGLALGILCIYCFFNAVDYATVFSLAPYASNLTINFFNITFNVLNISCALLFVGAVGKSAQLGLHTWLPDAIEGPTPVSALIHAATIVTAGVFLIARCSPIFEFSSTTLFIVTIFGAITAFFAATTGLLQNDIKRVIAYSTCSQLGYIIFACGLSSYSVGVFHLANHAFFKALLFLSAGSVIHAISDEQDIRKIGGLVQILPYTYSIILIGSLALIGFPFLTGFYSKDVILELAYAKYTVSGHFAHWLGTIAAFFTAFYSIRLLHIAFLSNPRSFRNVIEHSHDAPFAIAFPLFVLSIGSIFIGYITKDIIIGVGTDFWGAAIFTHPQNLTILEAEFIPHFIKLIPVLLSCFGGLFAYFAYSFFNEYLFRIKINNYGRHIYSFLNKKWFFDKVYNDIVGQSTLIISYTSTYQKIDRGIVEIFGPHGLAVNIYNASFSLTKAQTGHLYHYLLTILGFLAFFFVFFIILI